MEFLKKHYEKLILSVVLLGLAAAVAALPMKVSQEKQKEEDRKQALINPAVKPYPPVDLTTNQNVLTKVKTPITFEISGKHNLFNPVPWEKRPNAELFKIKTGNESGIGALKVVGTRPLQMIVKLDDVSGKDATDLKYIITVIRETDKTPKNTRALSKGTPTAIGMVKDVVGPPEAPTEIIFTAPGGKQISISKEKPYTEVIGYAADLLYPPTGWTKPNARKDEEILVANDKYKIVAIDKDTVIFSANSNKKQTTKKVEEKGDAKPK
jgi:hypothetical protein